jgi:SAM-dependent methyltransferase
VRETDYTDEFFAEYSEVTRRSAEAIVPLVMQMVAPRTVIDLGCGTGTWLAEFERHGVEDYVGVDGEWVSPDTLEIPSEHFIEGRLDRPFTLDRGFDLAVSLEVAEHLPESAAKQFGDTVVRLAPCVLFSAAIPHQGGLHHLNEQWPGYWAALFAEHGYLVVDAIRPNVWSRPGIAFWYRQNTLIFVREGVIDAHPLLVHHRERTVESMLSLVHPRLLTHVVGDPDEHLRRLTAREQSLRELAYAFPRVGWRSLRWRLGRLSRRG